MAARPREVTAAVERLRLALDEVAAALASGDLVRLLTAQEGLLASQVPSTASRGWSDDERAELRIGLRRAKATLNGCCRLNGVLLNVVNDFLTGTEADYTREGALAVTVHALADSRVSCRV